MATTPPPRGRLRTPPAPLHGAGYDSYSPYSPSPRRSKRSTPESEVQSSNRQQDSSVFDEGDQDHNLCDKSQSLDECPSMPASPHGAHSDNFGQHNSFSHTKNNASPNAYDPFTSRSSSPKSNPHKPTQEFTMTAGMLPTPAKTPRKKEVQYPGPAARTLFPSSSQTMESTSIFSSRSKGKRYNGFSLESFHSDAHQKSSNAVEIFTDVRDRIPTLNSSANNPFVKHTKEADPWDSDESDGKTKRRKVSNAHERDSAIHEMVKRDDGVLSVFRGKKIFRKFKPEDLDEADGNGEPGLLGNMNGTPTARRLTRSSIKPRVLFPTAAQLRAREEKAKALEEAKIPAKGEGPEIGEEPVTDAEELETDKLNPKITFDSKNPPATPPSKTTYPTTPSTPLASGRSLRSHVKKAEFETPQNRPDSAKGKVSPFDRWSRVKAHSSPATKGKKRASSSLGRTQQSQSKKIHQSD